MQLPQFSNSWSLKIDCLLVISSSSNGFFCWKFLRPVWISASFFLGQLVSSGPVCYSTRWFFCKSVLLLVGSSASRIFCLLVIWPGGSSASRIFCKLVLLPVGSTVSWHFCQLVILPDDSSARYFLWQLSLLRVSSFTFGSPARCSQAQSCACGRSPRQASPHGSHVLSASPLAASWRCKWYVT